MVCMDVYGWERKCTEVESAVSGQRAVDYVVMMVMVMDTICVYKKR